MTLRLGEVVLIRMHFHQTPGSKVRPALVLLDTGDDDFVAAPVTSQQKVSEYDFSLNDWQSAGLNIASFVRIHKLTVLAKADVVKRLGSISDADRESLNLVLCRVFCAKNKGE